VKDIRRLTFLLALAFTLALVPAVSAQPPYEPLRCDVSKMWVGTGVTPFFGDHWEGSVSGEIEGDINVTIVWDRFTGDPYRTEHYYDEWVIKTADGKYIWGDYEGMYNFNTQIERVNGRITDADDEKFEYLIGCRIQLRFSVTYLKNPPILHKGMSAEGSMFILPSTGS
jgi:hypothetical protein